jgi:hypothetical protein
MEVTTVSGLWSDLPTEEKKWGIDPATLSTIQFDISEGALSGQLLKQLQHFFLGCRLATNNKNFLQKYVIPLNSNPSVDARIKTIVNSILFTQMPKECRLEKDEYDNYPIAFKGEGWGSDYCKFIEKFADMYNQLIDEKKSHLMHPSRLLKLIKYLGTTFSNPEITAKRLITYHCFGYYALEISEIKRRAEELLSKRKEEEMKLAALFQSGPNLIEDSKKLEEQDFGCISDRHCRKHVLLAYQKLASKEQLSILDRPEKELYDYQGDTNGITHPSLVDLAKAYYGKHFIVATHFGGVVKYLKTLRNNDLNVLKKHCQTEEVERLTWLIDYNQEELAKAEANYEKQLLNFEKKPENYKPGDFSFLSDSYFIPMLTDAYKAIEKLKLWSFFDNEPPEDTGYMFWGHPKMRQIAKELNSYGHTGASMAVTMRWMQRIRNKGWKVTVSKSLEGSAQMLGVLNRIRV